MEAYSTRTDTRYPSWDALVAAESHGWTVVTVMQQTTAKRTKVFARVHGLYTGVEGHREARKGAARARNRFKAAEKRGEVPRGVTLLTVSVEPVWESDD